MFELSNPILFELGLTSAVAALLETKILKKEGISWKLSAPEKHIHLKHDIAVILYQAVRELLINAKKHSNASNVEVIILQKEKTLCITIKDDGVGFTYPFKKLPNQEGGFGLFHIKETLYSIDGKLSIKSTPNDASIITITAPLVLESK